MEEIKSDLEITNTEELSENAVLRGKVDEDIEKESGDEVTKEILGKTIEDEIIVTDKDAEIKEEEEILEINKDVKTENVLDVDDKVYPIEKTIINTAVKIETTGRVIKENTKLCVKCGAPLVGRLMSAKYCVICAKKIKLERIKEKNRLKRKISSIYRFKGWINDGDIFNKVKVDLNNTTHNEKYQYFKKHHPAYVAIVKEEGLE